jgi:hypothetical protein
LEPRRSEEQEARSQEQEARSQELLLFRGWMLLFLINSPEGAAHASTGQNPVILKQIDFPLALKGRDNIPDAETRSRI